MHLFSICSLSCPPVYMKHQAGGTGGKAPPKKPQTQPERKAEIRITPFFVSFEFRANRSVQIAARTRNPEHLPGTKHLPALTRVGSSSRSRTKPCRVPLLFTGTRYILYQRCALPPSSTTAPKSWQQHTGLRVNPCDGAMPAQVQLLHTSDT